MSQPQCSELLGVREYGQNYIPAPHSLFQIGILSGYSGKMPSPCSGSLPLLKCNHMGALIFGASLRSDLINHGADLLRKKYSARSTLHWRSTPSIPFWNFKVLLSGISVTNKTFYFELFEIFIWKTPRVRTEEQKRAPYFLAYLDILNYLFCCGSRVLRK